MEIQFNSLKELYQRLLPALNNKKHELHRLGFKEIKSNDIWEYLKQTKWSKSHNLLLYEMVEDILNSDGILIDDFRKKVK